MAKRSTVKPYNGGEWTDARFRAFVVGALRQASNRWPPKYTVRKEAKVAYGTYMCAGYKAEPHKARAKDIKADHIDPVVDPATGFTTYDTFIKRLFCEKEGFQMLCIDCHQKKSNDEKVRRKLKS